MSDMACSKTSTASRELRPSQGFAAACAVLPKNSTSRAVIARRRSGVEVVLSLGVPREDDVGAGEGAVAQHERLAEDLFLGGRAVDADRAGQLLRDALAVRGDGSRDGRGPEEVVPASLAGRARDGRGLLRLARLLREAGKGVVLGEDRDDRSAGPGGRDERRRHPRHAARDREPLLFEHFLEQGGRFRLLQCRLGVVPDLARDVRPARRGRVEPRVGAGGRRARRGRGEGRGREREAESEGGGAAEGNLHRVPPNGGCVAWERQHTMARMRKSLVLGPVLLALAGSGPRAAGPSGGRPEEPDRRPRRLGSPRRPRAVPRQDGVEDRGQVHPVGLARRPEGAGERAARRLVHALGRRERREGRERRRASACPADVDLGADAVEARRDHLPAPAAPGNVRGPVPARGRRRTGRRDARRDDHGARDGVRVPRRGRRHGRGRPPERRRRRPRVREPGARPSERRKPREDPRARPRRSRSASCGSSAR